MLPGVSVRKKLYEKKPSFCLRSPDTFADYWLNLQEVKLRTRYCKVAPKYCEQVQRKLNIKPAVYTIHDATEVRSRQLVAGSRLYTMDNFFNGERIPNRVLFAMVNHDAYIGDYKKNPVNFQHFILEEITSKVDNQLMIYKFDVVKKTYMSLYSALACQWENKDYGCSSDITYEQILLGTTIFPFDLTPNHNTDNIQVPRLQSATLEPRFSAPLKFPVILLVFSEQPRVFHIPKDKQYIAVF